MTLYNIMYDVYSVYYNSNTFLLNEQSCILDILVNDGWK